MLTAEQFLRSGKVRDLYELPDGRVLLVASDRISAFDVVLPTRIPDKGRVLTGLLAEDSPQRLALKLQGGKVETIAKGDVEERSLSTMSLMPEGIEAQMTLIAQTGEGNYLAQQIKKEDE